ncbi:MAG: DUF6913 domain-containing protein [Bacteroides sp.]
MFAGIKRWWSRKRLLRFKRISRGVRTLRRLSSCTTFLFLFDAEDQQACEQINSFARELLRHGKQVMICSYSDAKELSLHLRGMQNATILRPTDLNWYERPVSERFLTMVNTPYDLLLDFTHEPAMPLLWLCATSQASIKVGFAPQPPLEYDLLIAAGERSSTRERLELLQQYLGEGLQE